MNNIPNTLRLAKLLHPDYQNMIITEVVELNELTKMYVMKAADGHELAYYEAGSYIPVFVELDGNVVERPYSLCSSPKEAENGVYKIAVKKSTGNYVSTFIIENWKVGDKVKLGAPMVAEVYNKLRDGQNIVALAGGVGITPFYSMAKAVVDGDNDHNLTLFYGANTKDELLFDDEWAALEEASGGKFKLVRVIANEDVEGCERGFITLDIMKKYADVDTATFFISGPPPMMSAMKKELAPLHLPKKRIRISMNGDGGFHTDKKGAYKLTIHMGGETYQTEALASETILVAIEKAGLKPAVYCRSGICGFCRAYVVSGTYEFATDEHGVRKMDQYFGFIHPCCSYPTSELEIVVQRAK